MGHASDILGLKPGAILDSLGEGVYVTDVNRKIVYWNKSAEAITGWRAQDIVGKTCYDDVLCHIDKDGHRLCGEEYCPLHRAIVTHQRSDVPIILFAQAKDGRRVPVHVSVAPIRNATGDVIGGVEAFQDLSAEFRDLQKAGKIQSAAIRQALPPNQRVKISARYVPKDIVGGDCYRFTCLDKDRYGFFLADASGHGVAGALYTMSLLSMWESNRDLLTDPPQFCESMNRNLCKFVTGEAFATAVCGLLDLKNETITLACAGGPSPLLFRGDQYRPLGGPGMPWGLMETSSYDAVRAEIRPGDCVLLFTDGATEINVSDQDQVDTAGLVEVLRQLGYPDKELDFEAVEQELLRRSNRIRFDDDVTFLDIRLT